MKCIIIDDEPLAVNVIKAYCDSIDSLEVLNTFTNPLEALDYLSDNNVDLVFTDIEMPQISGVDFIKSIEKNNPLIIFTTAYSQYALDGFELNAVDYLVKPIPFHRFIKAINRAKELFKLKHQENLKGNLFPSGFTKNTKDEFIFVKSEYENLKLQLDNILFIQGLKDYLKIYLISNKPVLTLMNFKSIEEKLNSPNFVRVHRSYIVNINQIESVQRNKIILSNHRIPIGEHYKGALFDILGI